MDSVIIRVAATEETLFGGAEVSLDAFRLLLEFVRDHATVCLTDQECQSLNKRLRTEPPSVRNRILSESLTHVLSQKLDVGLDSCSMREEILSLPVDLAIIDSEKARSIAFDTRDPQRGQSVEIAQVGLLTECVKVEELRRMARQSVIGLDDITLASYLEPLAKISSTIDVFDPYVFETHDGRLTWKKEIASTLRRLLNVVDREISLSIFTLSDHSQAAWTRPALSGSLSRLLDEICVAGGRDSANVSLTVCPKNWKDRNASGLTAKRVFHDRFVQFTVRSVNKRRVIQIGRGLEIKGAPTSVYYYPSEPKRVIDHLDNVRRVVLDGASRSSGYGFRLTKKFVP